MKRINGIIATPSSIQNAVIYSYFHFLFDLTEKNPDETEFCVPYSSYKTLFSSPQSTSLCQFAY